MTFANRTITRLAGTRPGQRIAARRLARHAIRALHATAAGDCGTGHRIVAAATTRYGHHAAVPMAAAWLSVAVGDHHGPDSIPEFADPFTGDPIGVEEIPPSIVWTAQALSACVRGDYGMRDALLEALPADCREHLAALLHTAAMAHRVRSRA